MIYVINENFVKPKSGMVTKFSSEQDARDVYGQSVKVSVSKNGVIVKSYDEDEYIELNPEKVFKPIKKDPNICYQISKMSGSDAGYAIYSNKHKVYADYNGIAKSPNDAVLFYDKGYAFKELNSRKPYFDEVQLVGYSGKKFFKVMKKNVKP